MTSKKAALFWIFMIAMALSVAWYTKGNDLDLDSALKDEDLDSMEYIFRHRQHQYSKNYLQQQYSKNYLLYMAANNNNTEIARILLKDGADLKQKILEGDETWDPLLKAVMNKNPEMTQLFLDFGAEISDKNENTRIRSRLLIAVENNDFQTAKLLIDHGANVNAYVGQFPHGTRPLYAAAEKNNTEMAKYIIDHGAKVRNYEWKPLNYAICQGNLPLLQLLIDAGANVDAKHIYNDMAILSVAVNCGNTNAMKMLIKNGASVNAKDARGKSPLDYAVEKRNKEAIKVLSDSFLQDN